MRYRTLNTAFIALYAWFYFLSSSWQQVFQREYKGGSSIVQFLLYLHYSSPWGKNQQKQSTTKRYQFRPAREDQDFLKASKHKITLVSSFVQWYNVSVVKIKRAAAAARCDQHQAACIGNRFTPHLHIRDNPPPQHSQYITRLLFWQGLKHWLSGFRLGYFSIHCWYRINALYARWT